MSFYIFNGYYSFKRTITRVGVGGSFYFNCGQYPERFDFMRVQTLYSKLDYRTEGGYYVENIYNFNTQTWSEFLDYGGTGQTFYADFFKETDEESINYQIVSDKFGKWLRDNIQDVNQLSSGFSIQGTNDGKGLFIRDIGFNAQSSILAIDLAIYRDGVLIDTLPYIDNQSLQWGLVYPITQSGTYSIKKISRDIRFTDSNISEPVTVLFDGDVSLTLYNFNGENDLLDKSNNLTNELALYGSFRDEVDVLNPTILVEQDTLITSNYCYIPSFKRWYYVTDIRNVRKGVWELSLHVDVLMSYKTQILEQEGIIDRNEFEYNGRIVDQTIPLSRNSGYLYTSAFLLNYKNGDYVSNEDDYLFYSDGTDNNKFVCVFETGSCWYPFEEGNEPPTLTPKPIVESIRNVIPEFKNIYNGIHSSTTAIIAYNRKELLALISEIQGYTWGQLLFNPIEYIQGFYLYPFNVKQVQDVATDTYVANTRLESEGHYIQPYIKTSPVTNLIIADTQNSINIYPLAYIDVYSNLFYRDDKFFLNTQPYSKVMLYLPYYGYYSFDVDKFDNNNRYLYVYVGINYYNGEGCYYLYSTETISTSVKDLVLFDSVKFTIGQSYSIQLTDERSRVRNSIYAGINFGISALKTAIQIGSFNWFNTNSVPTAGSNLSYDLGVISSAGGLVNSGISFAQTMFTPPNSTIKGASDSGSDFNILSNNLVYMVQEYPIIDDTSFSHNVGKPLCVNRNLSNVHGYTTISKIHLTNFSTATTNELNEILQLLSSGVRFP